MKASSRVVGMQAGDRMHIVERISQGDPVLLVPEPDNKFDPHAIAVYTAPVGSLNHPDQIVSSVRDPDHVGAISSDDRLLLLDRQAGYLPKELAAQLELPAEGIVGWISTVRFAPPADVFDEYGAASLSNPGEPTPAGFDVTAWLPRKPADPEGGGWGT